MNWFANRWLQDAFNLLRIHGEKPVRGVQPRTTLNPLMILTSVAAWERMMADLRRIVAVGSKESKLAERSIGASALVGWDGKPGDAARVLDAATAGLLPVSFDITVYDSATGKKLLNPRRCLGSTADVGVAVRDCIAMRNAVAHRGYGMLRENAEPLPLEGDAEMKAAINTSTARMVMATMVQIVIQTADVLSLFVGAVRAKQPREWWFVGDSPDDLAPPLWGGTKLPHVRVVTPRPQSV